MAARIALPRILRIGGGAFRESREVLQILGLERPLIVTDPFLRKSGLARMLVDYLRPFADPRIFSEAVSDPTVTSVKAGVDYLGREAHDCVIGLGGGSSIDT